MDKTTLQTTIFELQVLYKATIELYEKYFEMLEIAINRTPNEDLARLEELNELVAEANEALQADLSLFDKVVATDMEDLANMQDELKIHAIYSKLKQ